MALKQLVVLTFLGYKVSPHENPADFFVDLLHWDLPTQAKERLLLDEGAEATSEEEGSLTGKYMAFF